MMRISLRAMIEEVEYELRKRGEVYPRLVRRGSMRSGEAELHTARMKAVLDTLKWLNALLDEHGRKVLPDVVRRACGGDGGEHGVV